MGDRKKMKRNQRGLIVFAFSLAVLTSGCPPMAQDQGPFECLSTQQTNYSAKPSASEKVGQSKQALFLASKTTWKIKAIPVCWEDETYLDADQPYRDIVKNAVETSWEEALDFQQLSEDQRVHFTGWKKCSQSDTSGVRLRVSDEGPNTKLLGNKSAGVAGGVTFNFIFAKWGSLVCGADEDFRKKCIHHIAVHEFGHVLGFAHEQNRPDTDRETCTDAPAGDNGDVLLGPWDENSIMNYCNPKWNNDGELSPGDQMGVQAAYYPQYFNFDCVKLIELPTQSLKKYFKDYF